MSNENVWGVAVGEARRQADAMIIKGNSNKRDTTAFEV
jgi:hypothetical protein